MPDTGGTAAPPDAPVPDSPVRRSLLNASTSMACLPFPGSWPSIVLVSDPLSAKEGLGVIAKLPNEF